MEGKREGFGVFFSPEGERYEGEWTASKRHGRGRQTFAPKPGDDPDLPGADVYEGDWVMDERTGSGVMRYANGDVWTGEWVKGEKHGAGTFFNMQNRTRYEGCGSAGRRGAGRTRRWRRERTRRCSCRRSSSRTRGRWSSSPGETACDA